MKQATLRAIIAHVDDPAACSRALQTAAESQTGAWAYYMRRLARWIDAGMPDQTPFAVFVNGNAKLPFAAFSSLPEIDCPGAGACLAWCYSTKAWRYPAAFCRQLMNSLALRHRPEVVRVAWLKIRQGRTVRLYVDGDFCSPAILRFWMYACAERPDLSVYGYSKSWGLFLGYAASGRSFPANYVLNLSSGSRYDAATEQAMRALPIVRGTFVAVETVSRASYKPQDAAKLRDHHAELRAVGRATLGTSRVFACPGRCGDCLPHGEHACGSERMRGVPVVIAAH
jgi:hypothetical protein